MSEPTREGVAASMDDCLDGYGETWGTEREPYSPPDRVAAYCPDCGAVAHGVPPKGINHKRGCPNADVASGNS